MFNVSTLLLADAFKPATPVTNVVISETLRQFALLSDILQGSVATQLRYGGIFSDNIIAYFLLILRVKNFENRLKFDDKVTAYKKLCQIFWATLYVNYYCSFPVIST